MTDLQVTHKRILDLFEAVKETLPGLPGFRSLSIFGSLAEGRSDAYSDIDGMVVTDDLEAAKAQFLGLLEHIGPVEFSHVINVRPDEWNTTIAWRDQSYYHRLDLGLIDSDAAAAMAPDDRPLLLIEATPDPGLAPKEIDAYVPEYGSTGHFLLSQFIGCLRYGKSRRRERTLSCYRFASAASDWRLSLAYARLTGNPQFRSKLSTLEFVKLDKLLSPRNRAALLSGLDFSSETLMDATVLAAMQGMLDDALHLAAMLGEVIPVPVFERIHAFLAEELASTPTAHTSAPQREPFL